MFGKNKDEVAKGDGFADDVGGIVIDEVKIAKDFAEEFALDKKKEYPKLNLMILGKSGTGKSTLINNLFGEKVVEAGIGKPVTEEIKRIERKDYPLVIYDTPGLELGGDHDTENLLKSVQNAIKDGIDSGNVSKTIHVILYCISVTSRRVEDTELNFIRKLTDDKQYDVPVIVVLTQAFSKNDTNEMKRVIEAENLNIRGVVPVLAEDYEINDEYVAKAKGMDVLADVIDAVIPEAIEETFVKLEKANLELKKKKAQKIVITAAAAAMGIGFTPVPFADALLLVPTEGVMMARITAVYSLPREENYLKKLASGLIGATLGTIVGKATVKGVLKFVPVAGQVAGGVVSGMTAAVITTAIGNAYIEVLGLVSTGEVDLDFFATEKGKKEFAKIVKKKMKIKKSGDEIIASNV